MGGGRREKDGEARRRGNGGVEGTGRGEAHKILIPGTNALCLVHTN